MCVSSSFMRWGEVVYVFVCVMSVFLLHVLLRCVLEPSPTCFLLSTPCTLACFWKKGTKEQWSATRLRTVVRSILCHRDDDFSLGVSCFKIPDSVCNVTQRETAIDNRFHLTGFKQLFHKHQILLVWFMSRVPHFLSPSH